MATFTNITTSPTTTTLISKQNRPKSASVFTGGNIKKIVISNFSDDTGGATINLWWNLDGTATDYYLIKNVVMPKGTTLVLEDCLDFDRTKYNLKIRNTGTSPAITVIIK